MIKEYYKENNYKDYKRDNKKLSFNNWWVLTGLLEKEISYIESEIESEKENGKYYDDTPEEKQTRKNTIKELRKQLKELNTISEKLHY